MILLKESPFQQAYFNILLCVDAIDELVISVGAHAAILNGINKICKPSVVGSNPTTGSRLRPRRRRVRSIGRKEKQIKAMAKFVYVYILRTRSDSTRFYTGRTRDLIPDLPSFFFYENGSVWTKRARRSASCPVRSFGRFIETIRSGRRRKG